MIRRTVEEVTRSYATRRNHPAVDGTSRLSPYLAWGLVSPRQICHAVLSAENEGSHEGREQISRGNRMARVFLPPAVSLPHDSRPTSSPQVRLLPLVGRLPSLGELKFGNTGYPMVDAGMRQLYETGWMHNRVPMIVASFLVKHLLLPLDRRRQMVLGHSGRRRSCQQHARLAMGRRLRSGRRSLLPNLQSHHSR